MNLFPNDEDAKRLQSQTFILSEFLHEKVKDYQPPRLNRKALVHGHCHHKSQLHFEQEVDLLKKAGLDCDVPDSGCCGMAGSFGYEADHYNVGLACGERVLLRSVRHAASDELIVTDSFSCRKMIRQETDRRAMHFAQVLQMAIAEGPQGPSEPLPERQYTMLERTAVVPLSILALGAVTAGAGLWWGLRSAKS